MTKQISTLIECYRLPFFFAQFLHVEAVKAFRTEICNLQHLPLIIQSPTNKRFNIDFSNEITKS